MFRSTKQCFGSGFTKSGSGSSISGWISIRIRIRSGSGSNPDPGFWWPKIEKNYSCKKIWYFFYQILQFTYSIKDVQAAWEAFSPQKRTSSTSKHEISSNFFLFLWVIFLLFLPSWIHSPDWIKIQSGSENTAINIFLIFMTPVKG